MTNNFKDKVVLVTGASRGIGQSIAHDFAAHGAYVIGTATTETSAKNISTEFKTNNTDGSGMQLDISDPNSLAQFAEQLAQFDSPSILINNAGITRDNLLMRMKDDEWENVINVNLNGMYHVTKLCIKSMLKARYGRIINITSVVGLSGNPGQTNYAAAKAGMIGFTRSLAREVGARGVTVNAVAPGFIQTDMTAELGDEIRDNLLKQISLGRLGQPDEIAKVVRFLASDDAAYITGQTVNVNGGLYMG